MKPSSMHYQHKVPSNVPIPRYNFSLNSHDDYALQWLFFLIKLCQIIQWYMCVDDICLNRTSKMWKFRRIHCSAAYDLLLVFAGIRLVMAFVICFDLPLCVCVVVFFFFCIQILPQLTIYFTPRGMLLDVKSISLYDSMLIFFLWWQPSWIADPYKN